MKKVISLLLVIATLLSLCSMAFAATSFQYTDYLHTDWYFRYVEKAIANGWMNGVGGQDFNPNGTLNRAMFVTILHRMEGTPAATKAAGFSDVAKGAWYENAVNWAAENGVVTGYQDGRFGINDPLTREQMATILFRYATKDGAPVTLEENLTGFADHASVSSYAISAMNWAVGQNIITGAGNNLNPKGSSTRAQAATVLCRFDAREEAAKLTRADLEKAVVELAWSFSLKENKIQYDSQNMGDVLTKYYSGTYRVTEDVAPEYGTEDLGIFSVCSDYTQKTYYNALNERFMGFPLDWVTRCLWANTENVYGKDIVVARYWDSARIDSGHDVPVLKTTTNRKTSAEMRELFLNWEKTLRPGDIMVPNGHAMLYIGDGYVLDCAGDKYDLGTGVDAPEPAGAVSRLRPLLDCYVTGKESKNSWWFPEGEEGKSPTFAILRPIDAIVTDDGDGNPDNDKAIDAVSIPAATKSRQKFPGMDIDRTVDVGPLGALVTGENTTYTVNIINKTTNSRYMTYRKYKDSAYAGEAYKGLVVTETIPAGTEFVSATNGGKFENGKITWTVDVAAGETKALSYTVKVTAKAGETVVNDGGMVDNIPSNVLTNQVGGAGMTAEDKTALLNFFNNYEMDWVQTYGLKMTDETSGIEEIYKKVLGKKLELGTAQELFNSIYEQKYVDQRVALGYERGTNRTAYLYTPKADVYAKNPMLIRTYLGGKGTWFVDDQERTNEFKEDYLQPGDIVFHLTLDGSAKSSTPRKVKAAKIVLWLGDSKYALYDTATKAMIRGTGDEELWRGYTYDAFFAIRPTQAGALEESGQKVTPVDAAQAEAESRQKFPGIEVERTTSLGKFGTATTKAEVTYITTVKNGGTRNYTGLTVMEKVPMGAKLKSTEGGKEENGNIYWTVDVPAGKSVSVKYTVTVTAKGGETLEAGGKVDNIPSKILRTYVGRDLVNKAFLTRVEKLKGWSGEQILQEMELEGKRSLDQIRTIYTYLYNGKTELGSKASETIRGVGDTRNFFQTTGKTDKGYVMLDEGNSGGGSSTRMILVKGWWGGKEMDTSNSLITKETAVESDLMVGDIIYQLREGLTYCLYLGDGKFICMDTAAPNGTPPAAKTAAEVLESCFKDDVKAFSLMRPCHYMGN